MSKKQFLLACGALSCLAGVFGNAWADDQPATRRAVAAEERRPFLEQSRVEQSRVERSRVEAGRSLPKGSLPIARKSENPGRQDRVDQGKPRRPDIGEELRNRPAERARQADGDRDGALSREEADKSLPGLARHFDRIDADRNGSVSPEEVRAFREQRRQQRMDRDSGDPRY